MVNWFNSQWILLARAESRTPCSDSIMSLFLSSLTWLKPKNCHAWGVFIRNNSFYAIPLVNFCFIEELEREKRSSGEDDILQVVNWPSKTEQVINPFLQNRWVISPCLGRRRVNQFTNINKKQAWSFREIPHHWSTRSDSRDGLQRSWRETMLYQHQ